ncbi:uncharacterized protein ISCGN_032935 [Ixodes scapularis]
MALVPNLGKVPSLDNLRPASLTSGLDELLEHMVISRLQHFMEDAGFFYSTMFGSRSHLSTQDLLLQIKEDIIEIIFRTTPQVVLALDIKGAFENISQTLVLKNLASTGRGPHMYDCVRDFLSNRGATIVVELIRTDTIPVPSKSTRHEPKESNPIRFTQALAVNRITNTTPYLSLLSRAGQLERLALTQAGRSVLSSLGIPIAASQRETVQLPLALRHKIHVPPLRKADHVTMLRDSQAAIRRFHNGGVSPHASGLLESLPEIFGLLEILGRSQRSPAWNWSRPPAMSLSTETGTNSGGAQGPARGTESRANQFSLPGPFQAPKQPAGKKGAPGALHDVLSPGPLSSLFQAPFRPRNNLRESRVPQVTLGVHRHPSRFRHDLRLTGSLVPVVLLKMGSDAVISIARRRPALLRSNRAHLLLHQRQKALKA